MVPRLAGNGASFRGAGAYYLHDAPYEAANGETVYPSTTERVGPVALRNLAAEGAEAALDEMWRTAEAQAFLQSAAGSRASTTAKPVKTLSLAWHPSEQPTTEQMFSAADSFLEHMGWSEHQALYVIHTDQPHAHVHIVLNRVHPDSGRTLDDFREQIRAQVWALAYEREQGQILCEQRLDRDYAASFIPKNDRQIPNSVEKEGRAQEAPFVAMTAALRDLDGSERDLLADRQRLEREAFFAAAPAEFRAARADAFVAVRQEFRAPWKEHYATAKALMAEARGLAQGEPAAVFEQAARGAHGPVWQGLAAEATAATFDPRALAEASIAEQRTTLAEAQKTARIERQQAACQALFEQRAQTYRDMKERQREERAELRGLVEAADKGQPYDRERLAKLAFGDTAAPATRAFDALLAAKAANANSAALEPAPASNDNRPPRVRADAEVVARANGHIDLLLASARMTGSGSMVSMQMADMALLARRAERAAQEHARERQALAPGFGRGGEGEAAREISDRIQRINALDTRSEAEKQHDAEQAAGRAGRDRGGGPDR